MMVMLSIILPASTNNHLTGVFVLTGMKRNWRGKIKYRLSHKYLPDLWVPLRCSENDTCGEHFWLARKVLDLA